MRLDTYTEKNTSIKFIGKDQRARIGSIQQTEIHHMHRTPPNNPHIEASKGNKRA